MKKMILATAVIFGVAITAASFNFNSTDVSATVPGVNSLLSEGTTVGYSASGHSMDTKISSDGKYAVFSSIASDVISGDTNGVGDVFQRDIRTGTTSMITVSSSGVHSNGDSSRAAVSQTGRYVAFSSVATNLIDGRTTSSAYTQLYLRDTLNNTTTLISETTGNGLANANIYSNGVSADGRLILALTEATNLGPTVVNAPNQNAYIFDTVTGDFALVNAPASSVLGQNDYVDNAQMSCDGAFVVFDSNAQYVGLPNTSHREVLLLDRRGGNRITNVTSSSNSAAILPTISCNGNYIGFASVVNNLDSSTNGLPAGYGYHGYVYDRINEMYELFDRSSSGDIADAGLFNSYPNRSLQMNISDTGLVAFASKATNLTSTSVNGSTNHIYIRDINADTTELVSRSASNIAGNANSSFPTITSNGAWVAYDTAASNMVNNDSNARNDAVLSQTGY